MIEVRKLDMVVIPFVIEERGVVQFVKEFLVQFVIEARLVQFVIEARLVQFSLARGRALARRRAGPKAFVGPKACAGPKACWPEGILFPVSGASTTWR